jgi:hypothetical protein
MVISVKFKNIEENFSLGNEWIITNYISKSPREWLFFPGVIDYVCFKSNLLITGDNLFY